MTRDQKARLGDGEQKNAATVFEQSLRYILGLGMERTFQDVIGIPHHTQNGRTNGPALRGQNFGHGIFVLGHWVRLMVKRHGGCRRRIFLGRLIDGNGLRHGRHGGGGGGGGEKSVSWAKEGEKVENLSLFWLRTYKKCAVQ